MRIVNDNTHTVCVRFGGSSSMHVLEPGAWVDVNMPETVDHKKAVCFDIWCDVQRYHKSPDE